MVPQLLAIVRSVSSLANLDQILDIARVIFSFKIVVAFNCESHAETRLIQSQSILCRVVLWNSLNIDDWVMLVNHLSQLNDSIKQCHNHNKSREDASKGCVYALLSTDVESGHFSPEHIQALKDLSYVPLG